MGKHEKPTEKKLLDKACEIEDAIKSLGSDGVLGFSAMGIHLFSKAFLSVFKEYDTRPTEGGKFLFAEYNGHQFVAYLMEGEDELL